MTAPDVPATSPDRLAAEIAALRAYARSTRHDRISSSSWPLPGAVGHIERETRGVGRRDIESS